MHGTPYGPLLTRVALGEEKLLKTHWRFDFMDFVPPLPAISLRLIEDKRPLPKPADQDLDLHLKDADFNWYKAYVLALAQTHTTEEQRFKNSAFNFRNVSYTDLLARPPQFRGKVITVKGKLAVVRKEPAPRQSRRFVADLPSIYNGWIIPETRGAPPFVVVMTELPPEVEVSEKAQAEVTFLGYFLSFVQFPAEPGFGKTEKHRNCPYLVGKIIEAKDLPKESGSPQAPFSYYLVVTVLGGILVFSLLMVVLNIWLRRHDARVQEKLTEVRHQTNPFSNGLDEHPPGIEPESPPKEK